MHSQTMLLSAAWPRRPRVQQHHLPASCPFVSQCDQNASCVCRVTYLPDTKVANAATFEIQREDHTVGDPLVMQLHEDNAVAFAAYKIPHPLEYRLLIKVKTSSSANTPAEVYNGAIDALKAEVRAALGPRYQMQQVSA